jgi:hypothetical protein
MEVVAKALSAEGREILDLEVAGLLEIVIIGDKVRVLLGKGWRKERREEEKEERAKQDEPTEPGH